MRKKKNKPRYKKLKSFTIICVLTIGMVALFIVEEQCSIISGEENILGFQGELAEDGSIKASFFGVDISFFFR